MTEGNITSEYKAIIHNKINGLDDILAGDYYIPVIELPESDDRPIGKWERMHQAYLEEANPLLLNRPILTDKLHTYLADLDEQARESYLLMIRQMAQKEDLTGNLKRQSQWVWVKAMNSIASRAEEMVKSEMINA